MMVLIFIIVIILVLFACLFGYCNNEQEVDQSRPVIIASVKNTNQIQIKPATVSAIKSNINYDCCIHRYSVSFIPTATVQKNLNPIYQRSSISWNYYIVNLNEWQNCSDYFYHYTSIFNAQQILEDMVIYAKKPQKVQCFPKAVYFTSICPHSPDSAIVFNNYIYCNHKNKTKVKCAFAVRQSDLAFKYVYDRYKRDIFKYDYDIDLTALNFYIILRY